MRRWGIVQWLGLGILIPATQVRILVSQRRIGFFATAGLYLRAKALRGVCLWTGFTSFYFSMSSPQIACLRTQYICIVRFSCVARCLTITSFEILPISVRSPIKILLNNIMSCLEFMIAPASRITVFMCEKRVVSMRFANHQLQEKPVRMYTISSLLKLRIMCQMILDHSVKKNPEGFSTNQRATYVAPEGICGKAIF